MIMVPMWASYTTIWRTPWLRGISAVDLMGSRRRRFLWIRGTSISIACSRYNLIVKGWSVEWMQWNGMVAGIKRVLDLYGGAKPEAEQQQQQETCPLATTGLQTTPYPPTILPIRLRRPRHVRSATSLSTPHEQQSHLPSNASTSASAAGRRPNNSHGAMERKKKKRRSFVRTPSIISWTKMPTTSHVLLLVEAPGALARRVKVFDDHCSYYEQCSSKTFTRRANAPGATSVWWRRHLDRRVCGADQRFLNKSDQYRSFIQPEGYWKGNDRLRQQRHQRQDEHQDFNQFKCRLMNSVNVRQKATINIIIINTLGHAYK